MLQGKNSKLRMNKLIWFCKKKRKSTQDSPRSNFSRKCKKFKKETWWECKKFTRKNSWNTKSNIRMKAINPPWARETIFGGRKSDWKRIWAVTFSKDLSSTISRKGRNGTTTCMKDSNNRHHLPLKLLKRPDRLRNEVYQEDLFTKTCRDRIRAEP